jgi:hypothetical protein
MAGLPDGFGSFGKRPLFCVRVGCGKMTERKALRIPVRLIMAVLGCSSAMFSPQLNAHHSYAMFDSTKQLSLQGNVREFQWTNPHCFIQLHAQREGAAEEWSIQMDNPQSLYRRGWRPGSIKAGDRLTIVIHPTRDGSHSGRYVSAVGADGKPLLED